MAACAASYRFTIVDVEQFGSISDGGVWAHSKMSYLLDENLLDVSPKNKLPAH
jgi:hypothetical protein